MKFEEILPLLKNGKLAYREGWNGKNQHVIKFESSEMEPHFCIIIGDPNKKKNSWIPSAWDLFAQDWKIKVND